MWSPHARILINYINIPKRGEIELRFTSYSDLSFQPLFSAPLGARFRPIANKYDSISNAKVQVFGC